MSTTINGVTVRLEREEVNWKKYQITVQVASRVRPGLKTSASIDPGKAMDSRQLMRGIAAAASLGAEQLDKKYGDVIDPSTAIRDALQAFGEECRLIAELKKDLPSKLKRLLESSVLNAKERDVVGRMVWLTDRNRGLTRDEYEWVNQKIGQIHGSQL
jgi:hypothetical protein